MSDLGAFTSRPWCRRPAQRRCCQPDHPNHLQSHSIITVASVISIPTRCNILLKVVVIELATSAIVAWLLFFYSCEIHKPLASLLTRTLLESKQPIPDFWKPYIPTSWGKGRVEFDLYQLRSALLNITSREENETYQCDACALQCHRSPPKEVRS